MNTLDALKQALDDMGESFLTVFPATKQAMREAIAHEEARGVKPATDRSVLVQNLRKGAVELRDVARSCTTHPETTTNWKYALELEQAADMLEQDGIELADVGDELTVAYMQGHSKGVEAGKKQAQQVAVPAYTNGHCKNHSQPGGCQLHNLQCGFPACDIKAAPQPPQGEK